MSFPEPVDPYPPPDWSGRDSEACGATARPLRAAPEPDLFGELRLLAGAAAVGLVLAIGTAHLLRARLGPQAVSSPSPTGGATAGSETPRRRLAEAGVAGWVATVGGRADAVTVRAAHEEARRRDEREARAREEAQARVAARHAASGDDIINLDLPAEPTPVAKRSASIPASHRARRPARRKLPVPRPVEKELEEAETEATEVGAGDAEEAKPEDSKEMDAPAAGPFDRDAASSAMFGAARSATSCATPGGPSGRGKASVTLSPSGGVSAVDIGAPFAGTKTGSCVASLFRAIAIPPFTGGAVTLRKSFRVRASATLARESDEDEE